MSSGRDDKQINLALVGATGAVGQAALTILSEGLIRPTPQLHLVASSRSAGKKISFAAPDQERREYVVESISDFDFSKVQIAVFSAGSGVSEKFAVRAAKAGCIVIDNTSYFRYNDDYPLVVSEVNPQRIKSWRNPDVRIIANPNCSTMQIMVALKPIYDLVGIERYTAATYQAVSGAGAVALNTLATQNNDLVHERASYELKPFSEPIAGNVIPCIDSLMDNDYTKEEMKKLWETRKILEDNTIAVSATCVRVPVAYGHSVALHVETRKPLSADQARSLLARSSGVELVDGLDSRNKLQYPTPRTHAAGNNAVYVGRVRKDISHPNGLVLWVVSDNLRKGAALNALQIAKWLIDNNEV